MHVTPERLERLRGYARIERDAILEIRGRGGEDPLATLAEMPSIDELVVRELRDELLEERGQLAEFTLARIAGQSSSEDADMHRSNADRAEFELLREIAADCPELAVAVWLVADPLDIAA